MSINELYKLAGGGDKAAEKKLFEKLHERYKYIVQQKVSDSQDAEEIVQDSLMAVAHKYRGIDFRISFSSWAYKVLENRILFFYRTKGRSQKKMAELMNEQIHAEREIHDPVMKRQLLDCLQKVNEVNVRHARILNFIHQGFAIEQICRIMKITRNNAYILLSRARAMLKKCLEKGDIK